MQSTLKAEETRTKFEGILAHGQEQAGNALSLLAKNIPEDQVVPHGAVKFDGENGQLRMRLDLGDIDGGPSFTLHRNATRQVAQKANMPLKFVDYLADSGMNDELAFNFNRLFHSNQSPVHKDSEEKDSRYLLRQVGGEVRGFLSDKYRRLDTPQIVESFIDAYQKFDAVPVRSKYMDTRFSLKVALNRVLEPYPGEVIMYGLSFGNSDYGNGAISLRDYVLRLVCINGMTGEEGFRKIHLGARLGDDLRFSQNTYELDAKTISSAVRDVVGTLLAPEQVGNRVRLIRDAHEKKIDADLELNGLRKASKITKSESEGVAKIYTSADVEILPPGNSAWRLANAISSFAKETTPERAEELEVVAGHISGLN